MNKYIVSAVGLSGLLLLGSAPRVVLAHEGHDHGEGRSGYSKQEGSRRSEPPREEERSRYRRDQEESGRYAPQRDREDEAYDDDEEEDTSRSSSRRYPTLEQEQSSPREQRNRQR